MLVIDGEQRLKSLQFFYEGYFNPKQDEKSKKVFELNQVQPKFEGKTYETLEEEVVRPAGFEPATPTVSRWCSTAELRTQTGCGV